MLNIVFTGPAYDGKGHAVLRNDLTAACQKKGNMRVQTGVKADTNVVIASRTDTVKAKAAAKRGIAVFSYPEFIAKFLGDAELPSGAKPDKYVDMIEQDLLVPDFTDGAQLAALDVL